MAQSYPRWKNLIGRLSVSSEIELEGTHIELRLSRLDENNDWTGSAIAETPDGHRSWHINSCPHLDENGDPLSPERILIDAQRAVLDALAGELNDTVAKLTKLLRSARNQSALSCLESRCCDPKDANSKFCQVVMYDDNIFVANVSRVNRHFKATLSPAKAFHSLQERGHFR